MTDDWQHEMTGDARPRWRGMTGAEREREYSPSSVIGGNYQPHIDAYIRNSKTAYAQVSGVNTGRYGPKPANTLDLALPTGASPGNPCPLLVFIHGGYWQELSKTDSFFPAPECLAQGVGFAAIDYTLAPAATLDDIVAECRAALAWLARNAARHGYDPERIIVAGNSAGGHLTAMCALPDWKTGSQVPANVPAAVALISGIFDLEPLIATSVNDAVGMDVAMANRNSPQLLDVSGSPPTIIAWGEQETGEFKRQSRAFGQKLLDAGTPVQTIEIPNRNHFDIVFDLSNPATALGCRVAGLVKKPE